MESKRRSYSNTMKRIILLTIICFFLAAAGAQAEVLRYKDTGGRVHYVDDISKVPEKYRDQLKDAKPLPQIGKISAAKYSDYPLKLRTTGKNYGRKPVLLVTASCPYCRKAEALLDSKNVRYIRLDIDKSKEGRLLYQQLGARGVPVLKVGQKIVRGFSRSEILAAVGR